MLNNQDFTQERQKYLGGSDIGAILGLSKYRSPVDVWLEKTGKRNNPINSLPLRFGQFAEAFVASEYALATQVHLVQHDGAIIHPEYSFFQSHIDRFIVHPGQNLFNTEGKLQAHKILECKTANPFAQSEWGEKGTDQVPLIYVVQCLWYMILTGIDATDLAVLFGNTDFRIYKIYRDLELESLLLEKTLHFWQHHVQKDIPPAAQSEQDFRHLFQKATKHQSIEATENIYQQIQEFHRQQYSLQQIEDQMSLIKQDLMGYLQEAEVLTYQGQILATWKSPKPSTRWDTKQLGLDHPELTALYQIPIQNSRRLLIKEQKEGQI